MNHNYFSPLRILKDIAVGTAIVAGLTMSAWAQPAQPQQTEQNWAQHRQEVVKARLAKMAERLQINASCQPLQATSRISRKRHAPCSQANGSDSPSL